MKVFIYKIVSNIIPCISISVYGAGAPNSYEVQLSNYLTSFNSWHVMGDWCQATAYALILVLNATEIVNSLNRVKLIFVDLIDLIWEWWSNDLRERVERQMEREIIQVIERLLDNILEDNVYYSPYHVFLWSTKRMVASCKWHGSFYHLYYLSLHLSVHSFSQIIWPTFPNQILTLFSGFTT